MKKGRLVNSVLAKIIAYFLAVVSLYAALVSLAGIIAVSERGYYRKTLEQIEKEQIVDYAYSKALEVKNCLLYRDLAMQGLIMSYRDTNLQFEVESLKEGIVRGNYAGGETEYAFTYYMDLSRGKELTDREEGADYRISIYIDEDLSHWDELKSQFSLLEAGYPYLDDLFPLFILSAFLGICMFLFLLCSAGHREGRSGVPATGLARIPADLLTLAAALGGLWLLYVLQESVAASAVFPEINAFIQEFLGKSLLLAIGLAAGIGYCMILAIEGKAGTLWKSTLLCWCWKTLQRGARFLGKVFKNISQWMAISAKLPLLVLLILLAEVLAAGLMVGLTGIEALFFLWAAERILLFVLAAYFGVILYRLRQGARELAKGNLGYQVDPSGMFGECREHATDLNSLGGRLNQVVEERMKSERMKTELITNVSHDIKTPLTSIINYTDLIVKEETENKKITEYSLVLKRQSARLKKLIEDLVEVSKASTGNLEVHLAPCEASVLLTQVVGEYEQRLAEQDLELVTRLSVRSARIMADGKLLWRVFDNLLNNILKYAQPNTRVYLTVEEPEGRVEIAFKNVSRDPLDTTPEELKERFVRGDHSRNTEGNGLGLSIAESLTRLQGGEMQLYVDGDLFKVLLRFPGLPEETQG